MERNRVFYTVLGMRFWYTIASQKTMLVLFVKVLNLTLMFIFYTKVYEMLRLILLSQIFQLSNLCVLMVI